MNRILTSETQDATAYFLFGGAFAKHKEKIDHGDRYGRNGGILDFRFHAEPPLLRIGLALIGGFAIPSQP
jgi:hypothetical protein